MTEVVLFHHALGRTAGVIDLADRLRAAGHVVHTPDLFDGQVFDSVEDGVAFVEGIGMDQVIERGAAAVADLPADLVYAGISLGVLAAQKLAQSRPGAKGALLVSACVPTEFFGPWPDGVPVQIHAKEHDPIFTGDGDLDAAREIVASAADAELFLSPGDDHDLLDSSVPTFDPVTADRFVERALAFLARV